LIAKSSSGPQPAGRKEVVFIDTETVVVLVISAVTLVVALIGLMVKLVELSRK
jgi:hypothetical protein